jgi:hypothetical protein
VAVLGEDERRTLRELEQGLQAEDSAFVQQFAATAPRRPEPTGHALIHVLGALVMAGLMLLAGSMAGSVAFTGVAVAVGLAWWYANEPTGRTDQIS